MSEKESSREDSPGMRKSEYEESPEGELRGQRRNLETKPTAENDLPTERSHAGNSTVMLETTGDVSEKNTSGIKVDSTVSPVDDKDWVLVNHPELVIGSQQTERNLKWRRVRVPDPRVSSAFFAIDENGEETASSATSLLVPGSGLKELKVRQEFRQFSIANATPYWDINFVRDEPAHATPGIHSQDPPELARASGQDDEMKEDEQERVSPSKPEDAAVSEMDFDEMLFQENKELTANEASSQTNISPKPKTTPPTPHFNSGKSRSKSQGTLSSAHTPSSGLSTSTTSSDNTADVTTVMPRYSITTLPSIKKEFTRQKILDIIYSHKGDRPLQPLAVNIDPKTVLQIKIFPYGLEEYVKKQVTLHAHVQSSIRKHSSAAGETELKYRLVTEITHDDLTESLPAVRNLEFTLDQVNLPVLPLFPWITLLHSKSTKFHFLFRVETLRHIKTKQPMQSQSPQPIPKKRESNN